MPSDARAVRAKPPRVVGCGTCGDGPCEGLRSDRLSSAWLVVGARNAHSFTSSAESAATASLGTGPGSSRNVTWVVMVVALTTMRSVRCGLAAVCTPVRIVMPAVGFSENLLKRAFKYCSVLGTSAGTSTICVKGVLSSNAERAGIFTPNASTVPSSSSSA